MFFFSISRKYYFSEIDKVWQKGAGVAAMGGSCFFEKIFLGRLSCWHRVNEV